MDYVIVNGELYHHGVKGMKWGVRRKLDQIRSDKKKRKQAADTDMTPEALKARQDRKRKLKKIGIGVGIGVATVQAAMGLVGGALISRAFLNGETNRGSQFVDSFDFDRFGVDTAKISTAKISTANISTFTPETFSPDRFNI